jgi:uncharacterized protein YecE (DUF72 family)
MSDVRIGPAGWSYDDWKGRVYPDPVPRGFDPLAYLSRFFDFIEINSTFYRPAAAAMSQAWARRTPDAFVFAAKAWERFTHDRDPVPPAEARVFLDGLAPLRDAGKLGAVLLQYPWFFQDSVVSRDRLRRAVDALRSLAPLVVELRHRSWLGALDVLRGLELGFCNIDQPASGSALTGTRILTGPVGYIRLHGRNAKAWFSRTAGRDEKYDYLYSPEELRGWVEAAESMSAADRLFIVTNNHFQGKAVVNALQLARALGRTVEVPDSLRASYPAQLG